MDQRVKWISPERRVAVPLGEGVEAITEGIGDWIHRVLQVPPPEPCDEVDFRNISLRDWRRAILEWCNSRFVRRAYGDELTRGLAMAIQDFDDATLLAFLESVV